MVFSISHIGVQYHEALGFSIKLKIRNAETGATELTAEELRTIPPLFQQALQPDAGHFSLHRTFYQYNVHYHDDGKQPTYSAELMLTTNSKFTLAPCLSDSRTRLDFMSRLTGARLCMGYIMDLLDCVVANATILGIDPEHCDASVRCAFSSLPEHCYTTLKDLKKGVGEYSTKATSAQRA